MPIALQHALSNKIATGSATPMNAKEYSLSKKIRIKTAGGEKECAACKANAKSPNPGKPPVHPNCRCKVGRK